MSHPTPQRFVELVFGLQRTEAVDAYAAVLEALELANAIAVSAVQFQDAEHARAERYLEAIRRYVGPPDTVGAGSWMSPYDVLRAIAEEGSEKPA